MSLESASVFHLIKVIRVMDDLFPLKFNTTRPVTVAWDESNLSISPTVPSLIPLLKVEVKTIESDEITKEGADGELVTIKTGSKVRRRVVPLFDKISAPGGGGIVTMHGFIDLVLSHLKSSNIPYQLHDLRGPPPIPNMDAMHGFRYSQEQLLRDALVQRRSGLIGAPTRFGKSTLIKNCCRAFAGYPIVVCLPGKDLIDQMHSELCQALPDRTITKVGGGSSGKQCHDITVCSIDSLHKLDPAKVRVLLLDEPHALPTDSRMPEFVKFGKALKLGFGATLEGRFDGRDPMITGLVGPVLSNRTYQEAVHEGAIAPIVVYMIRLPISAKHLRNRNSAYKKHFFQSDRVGRIMRQLFTPGEIIPAAWQSLCFINNEDQVDFLAGYLRGLPYEVAMAKLLTAADRRELMHRMKTGETMRALATHIYAQGVTFSDLRVMINAAGGGASTQSIQKPGRVAEIRPGKKAGIVIDFLCVPDDSLRNAKGSDMSWALVRESAARFENYKKTGFYTYVVDDLNQIKQALDTLI